MSEILIDLIDEVPAVFSLLSSTDSLFYSPSISGELYTGPIETREARLAIGALTNLVYAATRASRVSKQALSWRNFPVGSSAIMVNFEGGMMGYLDGCNIKPASGKSGLNIHAEQMAISKGRRAGLNKVVGLTVFAEPNDSDANPTERPTLAPCGRCIEMFSYIPEVVDNTLVLGTNPDFSICELYTVRELSDSGEQLVGRSFPLKTENDLEYYDRNIKPHLVFKLLELIDR